MIGMQSKILLEEALENRGYNFMTMTQHGDTPTLIASRRPVLQQHEVILSDNRSALCILIDPSSSPLRTGTTEVAECRDDTGSSSGNTDINSNTNTNSKNQNKNNYCWIVGTHLDAFAA